MLLILRKTLPAELMQKTLPFLTRMVDNGQVIFLHDEIFDMNRHLINTIKILHEEAISGPSEIISVALCQGVKFQVIPIEEIVEAFDDDVAIIIKGIININEFSDSNPPMDSEHFIKFILSLAEDLRVIPVKIASRLHLMRNLDKYAKSFQDKTYNEVTNVYIYFAHKLGFYKLKSELEDLCLKYKDPKAYHHIEQLLKRSQSERNKYIDEFITPIEAELKKTGLNYLIKGRVKSISSIHNKMKNQNLTIKDIYDIFAVRIIIDSPIEKEKTNCWLTYSIVTEIYTPNPKRLKDWLSIPKSNGYESLHITVLGPDSKWVEIQIRSKRMDEIAEFGQAAHWKYKGIRSQQLFDSWLYNLRDVLKNENIHSDERINHFRVDIYDNEIYVFTTMGDLYKLPYGSSVLDFAFALDEQLGYKCVSGKINSKSVSVRNKLNNGDQIEILTSPTQTPKREWLKYVVTSKAKNKIYEWLERNNEIHIDIAKVMIGEHFENQNVKLNEKMLEKVSRNMGFESTSDLYAKVIDKSLEISLIAEQYASIEQEIHDQNEEFEAIETEKLRLIPLPTSEGADIVNEVWMQEFKLANCCKPIYGDLICGLISHREVQVHRETCPKCQELLAKQSERTFVKAEWTEKAKGDYIITLRITGISKTNIFECLYLMTNSEKGLKIKSINIDIDKDSNRFSGSITLIVNSVEKVDLLISKMQDIGDFESIDRV